MDLPDEIIGIEKLRVGLARQRFERDLRREGWYLDFILLIAGMGALDGNAEHHAHGEQRAHQTQTQLSVPSSRLTAPARDTRCSRRSVPTNKDKRLGETHYSGRYFFAAR